MLVSAEMARGPRCLRWMLETWSGPSAFEFLRFFIILRTASVVNGGGWDESIFIFLSFLVIFLLFG